MPAGNTTDETVRPILIAVTVLLLTVATISFAGVANADEQDSAFESFDAGFASANPEAPPDVTVQWELAADAGDVDELRIAVRNESDEPINLYKPSDTDVPNPFTVSTADAESEDTDIVVDNLTAATLALKIPVDHCSRVDAVRASAYDGDNGTTDAPDVRRELKCDSDTDTGTFAVTIDEYDEGVTAGERVNVTAEVENTGDLEGSQDVSFLVDGDVIDVRENLTLGANQSETVPFSYETNESDVPEFEIAVESEDDNATRTVEVTQPEPAFFAVEIEDAPTEVAAGETIDVAVRIENTGGDSGTQSVTLTDFDGEIVDTTPPLDLAPDETTNVSLNWSTESADTGAGNATVRSENETDTERIEIRPPVVESIAATLDETVLTAGEYTFVTVEARFTNGSTVNVTDDATFGSLNTTVATTTANGTVLAETEGTVGIEAVYEGESDTDALVVQAPESGKGASESDESDSESGSESDGSDSGGGSGEDGSGSGSESGGSGSDGLDSVLDDSGSESESESETEGESDDSGSGSGENESGSDESGSESDGSEADTGESGDEREDASDRHDSGNGTDGLDAPDGRTSSVVVSPVVGWLLLVPFLAVRDWPFTF